jgi:hypothetical protein
MEHRAAQGRLSGTSSRLDLMARRRPHDQPTRANVIGQGLGRPWFDGGSCVRRDRTSRLVRWDDSMAWMAPTPARCASRAPPLPWRVQFDGQDVIPARPVPPLTDLRYVDEVIGSTLARSPRRTSTVNRRARSGASPAKHRLPGHILRPARPATGCRSSTTSRRSPSGTWRTGGDVLS